jgi:Mg-chelatase subunit ChlD
MINSIAEGIAAELEKTMPGLKIQLNFALVPFRDHADAVPQIVDFESTDEAPARDVQLARFKAAVQAMTGEGGDDLAEDVLGAVSRAVKSLKWRGRARFLLLIGDGPAHGFAPPGMSDKHVQQASPTMDEVAALLVTKEVKPFFCRVRNEATAKTEMALSRAYKTVADPKFEDERCCLVPVNMFDARVVAESRTHIVFCLDGSGSMSGQPWAELMVAYRGFLDKRSADQSGADDKVSVIVFDETTHDGPIGVSIDVARRQNLTFPCGGTAFAPAMGRAREVLHHEPTDVRCLVIFMTDGENGDRDETTTARRDLLARANIVLHTVYFGSGGSEYLEGLASTPKLYHLAQNGAELLSTFRQIAAEGESTKQIYDKISNDLVSELTQQLVLDNL